MNVVLSKHFVVRKELRSIPDGMAETIFTQANEHYKDTRTNYFIAVKRMKFQGAERDMALTYSITEDKIELVTLHPLKDGQRENRVRSRRCNGSGARHLTCQLIAWPPAQPGVILWGGYCAISSIGVLPGYKTIPL